MKNGLIATILIIVCSMFFFAFVLMLALQSGQPETVPGESSTESASDSSGGDSSGEPPVLQGAVTIEAYTTNPVDVFDGDMLVATLSAGYDSAHVNCYSGTLLIVIERAPGVDIEAIPYFDISLVSEENGELIYTCTISVYGDGYLILHE